MQWLLVPCEKVEEVGEVSVSISKRTALKRAGQTQSFWKLMINMISIEDTTKGHGVYVIGPTGPSHVKIGLTNNLYSRLGSLQSAIPNKIGVCCWFPCSSEYESRLVEAFLHARFSKYRVSGEHFKVSRNTRLWDFIDLFGGQETNTLAMLTEVAS